jgi:hypothetical protein
MQPGWARRAKCLPYEILMDLICGSPWGGSGGARCALHGASAVRRAKLTCHCRISNSVYLLQNRASASVYSERWQEKRRHATLRLSEPPSGLHPSSNRKNERETENSLFVSVLDYDCTACCMSYVPEMWIRGYSHIVCILTRE